MILYCIYLVLVEENCSSYTNYDLLIYELVRFLFSVAFTLSICHFTLVNACLLLLVIVFFLLHIHNYDQERITILECLEYRTA